jgi:hypothetical protein
LRPSIGAKGAAMTDERDNSALSAAALNARLDETGMEERVARIMARASLVRRAEFEGIDVAGSREVEIVIDCAVDFLWPDYVRTAHDVMLALGVMARG